MKSHAKREFSVAELNAAKARILAGVASLSAKPRTASEQAKLAELEGKSFTFSGKSRSERKLKHS